MLLQQDFVSREWVSARLNGRKNRIRELHGGCTYTGIEWELNGNGSVEGPVCGKFFLRVLYMHHTQCDKSTFFIGDVMVYTIKVKLDFTSI